MREVQKLLTFFQQKILAIFEKLTSENLMKRYISFEQLGPGH